MLKRFAMISAFREEAECRRCFHDCCMLSLLVCAIYTQILSSVKRLIFSLFSADVFWSRRGYFRRMAQASSSPAWFSSHRRRAFAPVQRCASSFFASLSLVQSFVVIYFLFFLQPTATGCQSAHIRYAMQQPFLSLVVIERFSLATSQAAITASCFRPLRAG